MFYFRIVRFPNSCIIEFGIVSANAKCTIFEIARVLKTVILPAIEIFLILQIL